MTPDPGGTFESGGPPTPPTGLPLLAPLREFLRRHWLATGITLLIALAQATAPAALRDPLGDPIPPEWRLHAPLPYAALAPWFTLWDGVAMLSLSRLTGFVLGLALGYLAWRIVVRRRRPVRPRRAVLEELRTLGLALGAFAGFILVGVAWNQRPAVRLGGLALEELTVEPHSHTPASHDVTGWPVAGFSAEASRRWHQRAGVDVLFITDHNAPATWTAEEGRGEMGQAHLCPGVEVSAHGAHIIVLGTPLPPDHRPFRGSAANRARLFAEVRATPGAVAIASIPEYRGQVAALVAEGVQGFEIVSASPKANELPREERDSVIAVARRHGLALVAAGDQHGYGATPMAWNVLRLEGWRAEEQPLCAAVVARLRDGGPTAVRIVERTRLRPDHPLPAVLTPLGVVWLAWATMTSASLVGWLAWTWLTALGMRLVHDALRRRRTRAIMSTVSRHP